MIFFFEKCSDRSEHYFRIKNAFYYKKIIESCENIPADWKCSSGSTNHSICMRQCPAGNQVETIKCKCKNDQCRWERKGKPCNQFSVAGLEDNVHTGTLSEQLHIRRENEPFLNEQGSLTELTDENGLVLNQLFRDINLSNSGHMIFNVNYYRDSTL